MPDSPRGFRQIAGSASLPQAIMSVNDNFQQLFAFLEQAFGGRDARKGKDAGQEFTLRKKSNPHVKNNKFNNPNDELKDEPRDKIVFTERSRKTEKVKVYNPNDKEQWVEILRITELVMANKSTGEEWVWRLGNLEEIERNAKEGRDPESKGV